MAINQQIPSMILEDLGIGDLSKEAQEEIITQLGQNVLQHLTVAILEKVPEGKRQEFESLSATKDEEKIEAFLRTEIPNLDDFVKKEVKKSIGEYKKIRDSLVS